MIDRCQQKKMLSLESWHLTQVKGSSRNKATFYNIVCFLIYNKWQGHPGSVLEAVLEKWLPFLSWQRPKWRVEWWYRVRLLNVSEERAQGSSREWCEFTADKYRFSSGSVREGVRQALLKNSLSLFEDMLFRSWEIWPPYLCRSFSKALIVRSCSEKDSVSLQEACMSLAAHWHQAELDSSSLAYKSG